MEGREGAREGVGVAGCFLHLIENIRSFSYPRLERKLLTLLYYYMFHIV
jgi:hypothetical protein